ADSLAVRPAGGGAGPRPGGPRHRGHGLGRAATAAHRGGRPLRPPRHRLAQPPRPDRLPAFTPRGRAPPGRARAHPPPPPPPPPRPTPAPRRLPALPGVPPPPDIANVILSDQPHQRGSSDASQAAPADEEMKPGG